MAGLLQQVQSGVGLWLGVALALALLSALLRSAGFKGWLGEYKVRRWLARDLDPQRYRGLHNVTLRLADGSTTQIDHVVVSLYGVFVLETKHIQGWIFGTEKQPTWTQTIYRHRSSFQNPLRQNWRHIKALEEVLQLPLPQLHSVVVFTADATFKTAMPACVTQGRGCIAFIQSHTQAVLTPAQVTQCVRTLTQQRQQATRATHQAHVAHLAERHAQASHKVIPDKKLVPKLRKAPVLPPADALAAGRASKAQNAAEVAVQALTACPECGDSLVRRSLPHVDGSMRYFWRCQCFPHCRFLQAEAPELAQDV